MPVRFLAERAIDLAIVVFGVSIIVFLMIRMIPGDAVAIMLGANTEITPERLASLRARVGLDRPLVEQYLVWAGRALSGDLGTSLWTGKPVVEEIAANLGVTLQLLLMWRRRRHRAACRHHRRHHGPFILAGDRDDPGAGDPRARLSQPGPRAVRAGSAG
jgi:hypothetical protein